MVQVDVTKAEELRPVFTHFPIQYVIHFAALKAVGESISVPLKYYRNNLDGLMTLLECMEEAGVKNLVFSSSATVYGSAAPPCLETSPVGIGLTNPYGETKFMAELMLAAYQRANPGTCIVALRYFNPVGAHPSGTIGEDPSDIPNNLMPYIQRVACGALPKLTIFGDDYATADGTAERDFVHVMDLASGHVKALEWLQKEPQSKGVYDVFNLGTGKRYSVKQMVAAYEVACGHSIPYVIGSRREGDLAGLWADASKAKTVLGWEATHDLAAMCADSWRWVQTALAPKAPAAPST
ncbi:UDP-glucose 4-epimerase GalE [archaeon]|nr:MAG: UDP-glucose 4-epimerase GalE [archaeon]